MEGERVRVEVVEEKLEVGKRLEERVARVYVRPTERVERVEIPLESHEVALERVPVDRYVDEVPSVRQEGDVTVIPVVEEVATVRLRLVEEVRVSRRRTTRVHQEEVLLRKSEVALEGATTDSANA